MGHPVGSEQPANQIVMMANQPQMHPSIYMMSPAAAMGAQMGNNQQVFMMQPPAMGAQLATPYISMQLMGGAVAVPNAETAAITVTVPQQNLARVMASMSGAFGANMMMPQFFQRM
jgi:hypothetical protein